MGTLINSKVTFSKIILLMIVGLVAIAYNINLFTSDYNSKKKAISIDQVYYKWDKRKVNTKDVVSLKNRLAEKILAKKKAIEQKQKLIAIDSVEKNRDINSSTFDLNNELKSYTSVESVGDVKIKKDELLYVKFCNSEQNNNKDSILKLKNEDKICLEFWRSSINYVGYKREKNKIILYGIEDFDEVNLKFAKSKICLKYKDRYFEMEEHMDFQPFTPISNENLIAIINEEDEL